MTRTRTARTSVWRQRKAQYRAGRLASGSLPAPQFSSFDAFLRAQLARVKDATRPSVRETLSRYTRRELLSADLATCDMERRGSC